MEATAQQQRYRTLIRIETLDSAVSWKWASAVLPGWSTDTIVHIPRAAIPEEIAGRMVSTSRLYAVVNLAALHPADLQPDTWEMEGDGTMSPERKAEVEAMFFGKKGKSE